MYAGTTREDIQKYMMKRLVETRLKEQEKRKAMYDADNEITSDGSKSLKIVCYILYLFSDFFCFYNEIFGSLSIGIGK